MLLSFKLTVSWICFSASRLVPLSLLLALFNSACVKNVHSVSNDNFYIVKAAHGDPKKSANQVKPHEDAALKTERPKGSKAPTAKTSVTNADLVEQKHPVIVALMEKIRQNPNDPQN